jgi:hypothetical protein
MKESACIENKIIYEGFMKVTVHCITQKPNKRLRAEVRVFFSLLTGCGASLCGGNTAFSPVNQFTTFTLARCCFSKGKVNKSSRNENGGEK